MKIFGLVLASYILFLSIEPSIRALSLTARQATSCCNDRSCQPIEKKQPDKKQEKKDCNDKDNCNPFLSCSNCIGFTTDFILLHLSPIIAFSETYRKNNEKVPPAISLEFWQPPKIA